jgi:DNA relaxase NicK|tara:strand:+ start:326 stop:616 length:291 start_codon:yes stop_codon:yes gene_type:complete
MLDFMKRYDKIDGIVMNLIINIINSEWYQKICIFLGLLMLIPVELRLNEGKYINALFNMVVAFVVVVTNIVRLHARKKLMNNIKYVSVVDGQIIKK